MAVSPQEAYQKAHDSTVEAAEFKVAAALKSQFDNLNAFYFQGSLATPASDAEYTRMAKELIDKRHLTTKDKSGNERIIKLDELDAKDQENGGKIAQAMGVRHLQNAIPTREQLEAMGDAVGRGAQENTGTIGFLQGATLGDALMGLLSWVFGGFAGGFDGLKQAIAGQTAHSMANSVGENLEALKAKRPDMAQFLTTNTIGDAVEHTHDAVRVAAGLQPEGRKPTLADVKPATLGDNELAAVGHGIEQKIRDSNLDKDIAGMLEEKINEKTGGWKVVRYFAAPDKEKVASASQKIEDRIAAKVSALTVDKNFRSNDGRRLAELDRSEFAAAISHEVVADLMTHKDDLGIKSITDKLAKDPKALADLETAFAGKLEGNYDQLHPITVAVARADARKVAQANPEQSNGVSGGVDAKAPSAPATYAAATRNEPQTGRGS